MERRGSSVLRRGCYGAPVVVIFYSLRSWHTSQQSVQVMRQQLVGTMEAVLSCDISIEEEGCW